MLMFVAKQLNCVSSKCAVNTRPTEGVGAGGRRIPNVFFRKGVP